MMLSLGGVLIVGSFAKIAGHGYVREPPARNMWCGVMCKPNGFGCENLPQCASAFREDNDGGYQYMSVLTHDLGRGGSMGSVTALPTNVCGFDSETWFGGPTPWDRTGVDWPTTEVDPRNPLKMVWDVSYGPHFGDTEEFVHYITKDGFVFDANAPLTWEDFEPEPFCVLRHDDEAVEAREVDQEFDTWCPIPLTKRGRHIIYTEWGRNEWTLERFHGCIDIVVNDGIPAAPVPAPPTDAVAPPPVAAPQNSASGAPVEPNTYPCCGWRGDCEQPKNIWCSAECGRCTENCNGVFYTAPGVGSRTCSDEMTSSPEQNADTNPTMTLLPTEQQTASPTTSPTASPTMPPTESPTRSPTTSSTNSPTQNTLSPDASPDSETDPLDDSLALPDSSNSAIVLNPENISYPCCGWNGDCQLANNTWCHAECGRCTGPCEGIYYRGPETQFETCADAPQMEPTEAPTPEVMNPDNIPYPCCGWNGDCQHPDNVWCHAECGRCTGPCEGIYYAAPGIGGAFCDQRGDPIVTTPSPVPGAVRAVSPPSKARSHATELALPVSGFLFAIYLLTLCW